jgi:hypothetical protein|tara:strand:+ start:703 stop:2757 length:2055 start_codon:yes stop_codon:yes gene_type:complete
MPPRKVNRKLEAAVQYLSEGLSVIPLKPNEKRPLLSSWAQLQTARMTVDEVNEVWESEPDANVGIVTGQISGLSVLDIDGAPGALAIQKADISLPETRVVRTPNGLHYYFQFTDDMKQSAGIIDHVDIRSTGGYVVAPPSTVEGKEYKVAKNLAPVFWTDIPEQLLGRKPSPTGISAPITSAGAPWVSEALEQGAPEGQRDQMATRLAGYFHSRGVQPDIIMSTLAPFADRCTPPMALSDLTRVIKSVTRYEQSKIRSHLGVKIKDPLVKISEAGVVTVMFPDDGVTMTFDRPFKGRTSVTTQVTIETTDLGYLIGPVRYDTLSTSKTTELVRALDKREQRPWLEMLSAAARLVTFSVETTAEFVDLRKSVRSPASRWAVKPITPALKPSVLYADGGSGKSTLAVAICMSVASGIEIVPGITPEVVGNAMYLDWESDEDDVLDMVDKIARGLGPRGPLGELLTHADFDITYVSCGDNLSGMAEEVEKKAEEHGTVFSVVDSAVPASSDDVNDVEAPKALFRALRQIGVPSLILAHVAKGQGDEKKPFGSAFWWNYSRSVWRMSSEQVPDADYITVGLEHRKANGFKLQPPMAIRVDHGADTIKFTSTSVMGMSKLASGLPVQYQISRLLSDGKPRTVSEIATELSDGSPKQVSSDSVDKALKRGEFQQVIDMTTGSTRKVWLNT